MEENKNVEEYLQEFLRELKYNRKINIEKKLENRVDIDYVIERIQDCLKTKEIRCNMCDGEMKYNEYNGTHIWCCNDCPNVQIEYYNKNDLNNLKKYLEE